MKIAYFINTFQSINWGGQASSNGIKHLLNLQYKNFEFTPIDLPLFKKFKFFKRFFDYMLCDAILNDDLKKIYRVLGYLDINEDFFSKYSHICFNGEGAIHWKSGHLVIFMALLYMAKKQNITVAAINQTIDFNGKKKLENIVSKVYNELDFVSVREPLSLKYSKKIGILNAKLIPDAAYGLPKLSSNEINNRVVKYSLPENFIGFTASSKLNKNRSSLIKVKKILKFISKKFDLPIVFLANAKTDIWMAHKLKNEFNLIIIEPPVKYLDSMAIISKASFVIGGRQHPNIFSYIYKVPYIPFEGNTSKNTGVTLLQNYSLSPLSWDVSEDHFSKVLDFISKEEIDFNTITIDSFDIFKKESK